MTSGIDSLLHLVNFGSSQRMNNLWIASFIFIRICFYWLSFCATFCRYLLGQMRKQPKLSYWNWFFVIVNFLDCFEFALRRNRVSGSYTLSSSWPKINRHLVRLFSSDGSFGVVHCSHSQYIWTLPLFSCYFIRILVWFVVCLFCTWGVVLFCYWMLFTMFEGFINRQQTV